MMMTNNLPSYLRGTNVCTYSQKYQICKVKDTYVGVSFGGTYVGTYVGVSFGGTYVGTYVGVSFGGTYVGT